MYTSIAMRTRCSTKIAIVFYDPDCNALAGTDEPIGWPLHADAAAAHDLPPPAALAGPFAFAGTTGQPARNNKDAPIFARCGMVKLLKRK